MADGKMRMEKYGWINADRKTKMWMTKCGWKVANDNMRMMKSL